MSNQPAISSVCQLNLRLPITNSKNGPSQRRIAHPLRAIFGHAIACLLRLFFRLEILPVLFAHAPLVRAIRRVIAPAARVIDELGAESLPRLINGDGADLVIIVGLCRPCSRCLHLG